MATAVVAHDRARAAEARSISAAALIGLSGLGMILAGILMAFFPILHPNHDPAGFTSPLWVPVHWMPAASMILALFGLVGLLARQLAHAGRLGVIGFAVAFVGSALILTDTDVEAFILPFVAQNATALMEGPPPPGWNESFALAALILGIGYLLLGIATARAGVLPRGAGVSLALGGLALGLGIVGSSFLPPLLLAGALLFGLALAWVGYALWAEPRPSSAH